MDENNGVGETFYSEHKEEILEEIFTELKKMRRGTSVSTNMLFFKLFPEILKDSTDKDFLMEVHGDLFERSRRNGLWFDVTKHRFLTEGLPYHITYEVRSVSDITYRRQMRATNLIEKDTWERQAWMDLINAFSPILDYSEYYFQTNTTDHSADILELYKTGNGHRLMGISIKKDMNVNAFFNEDFYNVIRKSVELPSNKYPNKTQPHVTISLKTLWNVLCTATGQGIIEE